ncbi:uncharacterized protein [Parasteatoda tepidariorum]|uniref:uncharacterized protein n=1 Tax=Parasteatoda tepidariorum TaxID=114398 RepID=UPI00077FBBCC|nr:uncharacterized protein LOC107448961 [Parasteatoda tepidariorum]
MARLPSFNSFFNCDFFRQSSDEVSLALASSLFTVAKEKLLNLCEDAPRDDTMADFDHKLEMTKGNLKRIIRTFNHASRATPEFLQSCPTWAVSRKNTIAELRRLAKKINTDRRNCNSAKVGSSSIGIMGGLVGVSAFIFPPAAMILGIVGLATAVVGGAATFGTSVTEIALLNKSIKKATNVLRNDQDTFKNMTPWFQHAQDLITLIETVIGFDVAKEVYRNFTDCNEDIAKLTALENGEVHPKLKELIEDCVEKTAPSGMKGILNENMLLIPAVVAFFFVAILLHSKNNLILGSVVRSHRLVLGLIKILDLGSDLGMTIASVAMKTGVVVTKEVSQATARMVAQSALFGFGIVLDVANLVITTIDIRKGSKSTKANDINAIADRMENELNVLESIYKELGGNSF